MTVESTTAKVTYNGNGVTTSFSFSFTIFASTDLTVIKTDTDGVETTLSEGSGTTNYSVTVASYPGSGSITYPASGSTELATGEKITIKRVLPLTQTTDLENQGGYFPETQERVYDRLVMIAQQIQEELDRAVKVDISSGDDPDDLLDDLLADVLATAASAAAAAASASAASASETAALAAQAAAEAAESGAIAAAASVGFSDVVFVAFADSPITLTSADAGKLYSVDTSGGAVAITLPLIANLTLPWSVGIKKSTADANAVTVTRAGTDTIDGNTSVSIAGVGGVHLFPDIDTSPDRWTSTTFGSSASSFQADDVFNGNGTAGPFTLSRDPGTENAIGVVVGGVYQDHTKYSISGTSLTFGTGNEPPVGTGNVVVFYKAGSALDVGVPSDASVTFAKVASSAIASQAEAEAGSSSTKLMTPQRVSQAVAALASVPRGQIFGLTLSNNVSDATNDVDISAGQAASDATSPATLTLAASITKRLDAAWSVGTNQGGLDTGAIADTTYHVWLIQRSDTGVVDVLFSTSASSPTMPTNYDRKRRIGSVVRASGAILAFTQVGDEFLLTTPVLDVNATNPGTSAVLRTLSVPSGIKVQAMVNVHISQLTSGRSVVYVSSPDQTDTAPSIGAAPGGLIAPSVGSNDESIQFMRVRTNTSAQIRTRHSASGASDVIRIATQGWIDTRGRHA